MVGVSKHTLYAWKKKFDTLGPAGLMDRPKGGPRGSRLPDLTKRTILMMKRSNPEWGCQKISDMLTRGPALPAIALQDQVTNLDAARRRFDGGRLLGEDRRRPFSAAADDLTKLMEALKGRGTIIWLHIGGKGPAFDSLTEKAPLVKTLRDLAGVAATNDLRIAVYPHIGEWTVHFADATKLAKVVNHKCFAVTFNLCHCLAMGDEERIPALLEDAKSVLFTATINGADSGVKGGQWHRLMQTLNKGSYDTRIVLRKLKQIEFDGPIGFQGYGIKGDSRSILRPTMETWSKWSAARD